MKYNSGSERIDIAYYIDQKNSIFANHLSRYKYFSKFLKENSIVIDAGCGYGISTQIISELKPDCKIIGIDLYESVIIEAKTRFCNNKNISFLKCDLHNTDFNNNYADAVIFMEVIAYLDNPDKAVSELHRVLKPDGVLVITTPNRLWPKEFISNQHHKQEFNFQELKELLEKHFDKIEYYVQLSRNPNFDPLSRYNKFHKRDNKKLSIKKAVLNHFHKFLPGIYEFVYFKIKNKHSYPTENDYYIEKLNDINIEKAFTLCFVCYKN